MNKLDKRIADLPEHIYRLAERINNLNAKWILNNSIAESKSTGPLAMEGLDANLKLMPDSDTVTMDFPLDKDAVYADNA